MLKLEYIDYKKKGKKSIIDIIYQDILHSIIDGLLFSGYKITEQQLCNKFKCSRTPIREVLRRLESDGLIEIVKNKGAFIVGFDKNTYNDLLEERHGLELLSLKLSIQRIESSESKLLTQTFDFLDFYYTQRDFSKLSKIIKGFYQIMYYATYNPRIEKELLLFYNCSNKKNMLDKFYEKYIDELYIYYHAIYNCYTDKNTDKALNTLKKIQTLFIDFYSNL